MFGFWNGVYARMIVVCKRCHRIKRIQAKSMSCYIYIQNKDIYSGKKDCDE